jgi:hypothetical protein
MLDMTPKFTVIVHVSKKGILIQSVRLAFCTGIILFLIIRFKYQRTLRCLFFSVFLFGHILILVRTCTHVHA